MGRNPFPNRIGWRVVYNIGPGAKHRPVRGADAVSGGGILLLTPMEALLPAAKGSLR